MQITKILIAPGLGSSGPIHWQTIWEEQNPEFKRIEQKDWSSPLRQDWVEKIETEVKEAGENVIIVAHSLACIATVFWAQKTLKKIKGALLVAPPDTERPDFPKEARGFAPIPLDKLPFYSIVVASTDDEYITTERCKLLADSWGSKFINIGAKGHINSASNLGDWEEGKSILDELLFTVSYKP
jgi:predicted alpha/beta hydrolase family esterase